MVVNLGLVAAATPKALDFDNPVQTKCSSGKGCSPRLRNSEGVQHTAIHHS